MQKDCANTMTQCYAITFKIHIFVSLFREGVGDLNIACVCCSLQVGWMWIDNGVCDNSLIVCSNFSGADSNQLQIQSLSFFPGQNDPVHIDMSLVCEMCPACVLRINVLSDFTTISETVNITCEGPSLTYDLTLNEDFTRVECSVTFDTSSTATQCLTIDGYRIWQYQDCPATVFQLANYQQTDPGIGPVDSTGCVANAQSDGTARAGCSGDSVWGTVVCDSAPCNCLAGFTPNNDLTACEGQYDHSHIHL